MCGRILRAVWDYKGADLDATQTAVLTRMAWYASEAGRDIFPSVITLATQLKLSERTVQRTLKHLKETGFIEVECPATNRHPAKYKINLAKLKLINEFNDASNVIPDQSRGDMVSSRGDMVSSRGDMVSSRGDMVTPDPTINHEVKNNNNTVVAVGELFNKANKYVSKQALTEFIVKYGEEQVRRQIVNLNKAKNVSKPEAWLEAALERTHNAQEQKSTPRESNGSPAVNSASYELYTDESYAASVRDAERRTDPNDWHEVALQEYMKKQTERLKAEAS